jgi:hypothetical protein
MLSRRSFFARISAGVAAASVLDPERLLWIPGARTISIPAPPRIAYNLAEWTRWKHVTLQDERMLAAAIRGDFGHTWFTRVPKIGDTLILHSPPRFGIAGIATAVFIA